MAGRAIEGVAKLCQRRLYSWLSSRCGLPVCIVGSILLLVSVLQFGEVGGKTARPRLTSWPCRYCWSGARRDTSTSSASTQTTSMASLTRDCEWTVVSPVVEGVSVSLSPPSLCPELPIDVVYTWVNGSDPELLEALRDLKRQQASSGR